MSSYLGCEDHASQPDLVLGAWHSVAAHPCGRLGEGERGCESSYKEQPVANYLGEARGDTSRRDCVFAIHYGYQNRSDRTVHLFPNSFNCPHLLPLSYKMASRMG